VGTGVIPETKNSAWEGRVGAIVTVMVLDAAMVGVVCMNDGCCCRCRCDDDRYKEGNYMGL